MAKTLDGVRHRRQRRARAVRALAGAGAHGAAGPRRRWSRTGSGSTTSPRRSRSRRPSPAGRSRWWWSRRLARWPIHRPSCSTRRLARGRGFDFTDITYHRAGRHRRGADRVRPAGGPQRVPPAHGRRALPGARPRPADARRRVRAAHRQRPVADATAAGRSAPAATSASAAAPATSTPRARRRDTVDPARAGRLHILEVQRLIRFMPKVVIAVVPGWAAGGGHSLHVVCDLTLASAEHARFKQTDADVASFDGGFGSAYLARQVGQKFAREIFFLGREYTAERRPPDGHGQRGRAARRARAGRARVGAGDQRQEPAPPSGCSSSRST